MKRAHISFILHRPSSAENIGAVARVMKNFGLARLGVVVPPSWQGLPRGRGPGTAKEEVLRRARKLARHASDLLERAEMHSDLKSALGDATWVCGTTSRRVEGRPQLSPRELAGEARRRLKSGPVAIVFGEERRGLSDRELELCQAVCTIPTSEDYASMNLAQSTAVIGYELAVAAEPAQQKGASKNSGNEPARHATLEALWQRLEALLLTVGYLNPQNPEHILADWRRLTGRVDPTQREVELILAAVRQLERAVEKPAKPSPRVRSRSA